MNPSISTAGAVVDDFQMSCRFSNFGDHAPESFDSLSCGACFYFIFMLVEHYKDRYVASLCEDTFGVLVCPVDVSDKICNCYNREYVYNIPEFALNSSRIKPLNHLRLDPPLPFQFDLIVKDCCSAARYCCRNTLVKYHHRVDDSPCPPTWDGWNCFDSATPGVVFKQCPNYIYGGSNIKTDYDRLSQKVCRSNGWATPEVNAAAREHTDYTGCMSNGDVEARILAGLLTYSASVIFLIPAVFLLTLLRPIRCQPMFILHRHLLISCLLYGAFYLITVSLFVVNDAPLSSQVFQNHLFCRLLFSIQLRYLRLTNFTWMLAEAVYLWRLLHTAQHSEGETLRSYKVICWGVPGVITVVYIFVRSLNDDVGMCWIENSTVAWIEWMIITPSLLAMGVNLLLLGLIVYILVKKLRCDPHLERIQYRKAVRGALMLIPVFGVQQLLTIYRFSNTYYQVTDQSLNGLQGMFVSFIVCYTNRSVVECVLKFWSSHQEKRALGAECRQRMSIQESGKLILRPPQTEHVVL
ncbi:G_PROTEIN_RECEP_F2_4 domain-containing protein [Caenorhabditis elegans]|uniref:G_PROTEIN_RECEP_F2_4 domain-containing protein n=1 Tax=Caenorhabditis elegans TaxID=6239 RepID=A7LPE2_CAEEL|nr:G_PROTEIN_RECEP_F2_4 domain-containing protein [Caenorhabditis elegans]CAO82061.1 G_PROTEIN_RECEP_F2_4 domain-containing protein [Caenorhabditis elegans]|eukprot:NP_001122749.1 G-protein coupled receptor seb-2 [Caenorhabditis elegans]